MESDKAGQHAASLSVSEKAKGMPLGMPQKKYLYSI